MTLQLAGEGGRKGTCKLLHKCVVQVVKLLYIYLYNLYDYLNVHVYACTVYISLVPRPHSPRKSGLVYTVCVYTYMYIVISQNSGNLDITVSCLRMITCTSHLLTNLQIVLML